MAPAVPVAERLGPGNFKRISRMTGISCHHVSRVCRGLREPSFDVACIIAEAAGVTLEQFKNHTHGIRTPRVAQPEYEDA